MSGRWEYRDAGQFAYGDDTTYKKGIAFLDGQGAIEDWGCGTAYAARFVSKSDYIGIDGSASPYAHKVTELTAHVSDVDCIFMRHVLEHNYEWKSILSNAIRSFRKRMVLIIFTPFSDETQQIAVNWLNIPDISFSKLDLTNLFTNCQYSEQQLYTNTQYGIRNDFLYSKRRK